MHSQHARTHTHADNRPHSHRNTLLALLYPQLLPSVQLFLPSLLASSPVVVMKGAERLSRAGIAFWFPQCLLSGSRRDSTLIVTTGAVLRIRGARRRWWGLRPRAGVGEYTRGFGRVQNKGGSGGDGVGGGRLDWRWTYRWNWSSRKVPSRDQGGRNCQSRRRNKRSEKWKWKEGLVFVLGTDRQSQSTEQNQAFFCLHPALVQHLEEKHYKTQEVFDGPKHPPKCMKRYLSRVQKKLM